MQQHVETRKCPHLHSLHTEPPRTPPTHPAGVSWTEAPCILSHTFHSLPQLEIGMIARVAGCDSLFITPQKAKRLSRVSVSELPETVSVILILHGRPCA